ILNYANNVPYADSNQEYIDAGLIRYPSELYFPIRLKPNGGYGLEGLREDISHIELRMIDLNPLVRAGMDERDVLFCQLFLVWLAAMPDISLSLRDQVEAVQNFKNASHYDLKTVKIVRPDQESYSVVKTAKKLLDRIEEFYEGYPDEIIECIEFEKRKFEDPHCRYAWKIREDYSEGYVARGIELAKGIQKKYLDDDSLMKAIGQAE
ncbi:MAG: hypothetical protein LUB61_01085, partial [Eggerthellaceae bacterium]|nr:hypothetical protein [Eggerthellaceae bacterium]